MPPILVNPRDDKQQERSVYGCIGLIYHQPHPKVLRTSRDCFVLPFDEVHIARMRYSSVAFAGTQWTRSECLSSEVHCREADPAVQSQPGISG